MEITFDAKVKSITAKPDEGELATVVQLEAILTAEELGNLGELATITDFEVVLRSRQLSFSDINAAGAR